MIIFYFKLVWLFSLKAAETWFAMYARGKFLVLLNITVATGILARLGNVPVVIIFNLKTVGVFCLKKLSRGSLNMLEIVLGNLCILLWRWRY